MFRRNALPSFFSNFAGNDDVRGVANVRQFDAVVGAAVVRP